MDQISPPMRIALAAAVLFLAAYMLVLKPKDDSTPAPATPAAQAPAAASASDGNAAQTSLGKAVEAAHGAADATEAKQNSEQAATGGTTATSPSTSQTSPGTSQAASGAQAKANDESLKGLPQWLQHSMDKKVVAILFTNGKSADDRRTAKALKHAYTAHGKVVTRAVPLSKIAKYRPVAEGADVQQSPTLMVIDRDRGAQTLVGYSSRDTINQSIIDGLLTTDNPVKHVKYLQTVQHECRQVVNQAILGETQGDTVEGARKNLDAIIAQLASSLGTLRNAAVPPAYKPLSKQVNHYFAVQLGAFKTARATAVGKNRVDPIKYARAFRGSGKSAGRTVLELNAVGVDACN